MRQWVTFIFTLIKYGKLFQPLYWKDSEKSSQSIFWKRMLLKTPVLCQIISIIGLYRLNKQWPQYVYHLPEKKLAYVWICKNASTSILASLLQTQYLEIDVNSLPVGEIHEKAKVHMKPCVEDGFECFSIVRHPYARLISCYQDKVRNNGEPSYFHSLYFGLFTNDMPFDQFVKFVGVIPDSIKEIHFKPQYQSLPIHANVKVFKIEQFDAKVSSYLSTHDVKVSNIHYNSSVDFSTTNELRQVEEIFSEDYRRFGYS